jgi:FlaA1/EpsC-like NDP-sugar epimerase
MREENKSKSEFLDNIKLASYWRFLAKLSIGCFVLILSILIAFLLHFEGKIPENYLSVFPFFVSVEVSLLIAWEFVFGTYRNLWRPTSFKDFSFVSALITLQKISFSALTLFFYPLYSYPRSTIISS